MSMQTVLKQNRAREKKHNAKAGSEVSSATNTRARIHALASDGIKFNMYSQIQIKSNIIKNLYHIFGYTYVAIYLTFYSYIATKIK